MSASTKSSAFALKTTVLAVALSLSAPSGYAQGGTNESPFKSLSGAWAGAGSITLGTGESERIRCRVTYDVNGSGNGLRQVIRCASDSYLFDMTSDVDYANGSLSGRWSERTRNMNGSLFGRASANRIEALAETAGFAASLTIITRGNRQSVRIQSKSKDLAEVSITLRRR